VRSKVRSRSRSRSPDRGKHRQEDKKSKHHSSKRKEEKGASKGTAGGKAGGREAASKQGGVHDRIVWNPDTAEVDSQGTAAVSSPRVGAGSGGKRAPAASGGGGVAAAGGAGSGGRGPRMTRNMAAMAINALKDPVKRSGSSVRQRHGEAETEEPSGRKSKKARR
jgi:hypothetical protein